MLSWSTAWLPFALAGAALIGGMAPAVAAGPVEEAPPVVLRLLPEAPVVAAGAPFEVAVLLDVPAGWHVYWENPGQSGLATEVALRAGGAPAAGPRWPAPERHEAEGLLSYVYEGTAGFLFTVSAAPAGPLALEAAASWLLCRERCVRGEGRVSDVVTVAAGAPVGSAAADPLAPYRARLPRPFEESGGTAWQDGALHVRLPGPGPFAVFPTEPLEAAWRPSLREEGGELWLDATLSGPLPPGARLLLRRGTGPAAPAFTLDLDPPSPPEPSR